MPHEKKISCFLRKGECPPECPYHEFSVEAQKCFGDDFDPLKVREALLLDPMVSPTVMSLIFAGCVNERKETNNTK